MHFVERIGPVLGIVAFLGLAILAFLLFLQARDIRRLREWAGRAPERAQEAAEASLAAAEARGEGTSPGEPAVRKPGLRERAAALRKRAQAALGPRLREVDRRSPVRPLYMLAALGAALAVVAVLTSGFGLVGGEEQHGRSGDGGRPPMPKVAVLNGTTTSGLAATVETQVVKPAGYRAGAVTNTTSSVATTVVTYEPGHQDEARALASAVRPKLGSAEVVPMTAEIRARAQGAPLALVLGLDDADFGAP